MSSTAPAATKLEVIEIACGCASRVDTLAIFLPGAYDTPQDFMRHGFVEAMHACGMAVDAVLVDAHVGYYPSGSIVDRLHEDVVLPARAKGYRHIWLVGISLGGYGALMYAQRHGAQLDGMFLMAPFLGNRSLVAEVARSGLAAWDAGTPEAGDHDRSLWAWLAASHVARQAGPPLYLAYGMQDRFVDSNRLLAAVLPQEVIITAAGGHEWSVWARLWQCFLERCLWPTRGDASDHAAIDRNDLP